ncbi:hypothetical protein [Paraburkholderia kirstenboschensis]|uniref:Uncharacterized protein n=1 Tax=Paraburkholderia kirstenboschensis TaxID=1245436 RepID=A0ABZ0ET55_9BURK|nr:hypothetical protein [Paraburkholderia kirstenboschensis]WOD19432.1 hypothetical protein RW095_24655 [Paraburkholderia kirstenboschensis]
MSQDKPTIQTPPFRALPLAVDPLGCDPRESYPPDAAAGCDMVVPDPWLFWTGWSVCEYARPDAADITVATSIEEKETFIFNLSLKHDPV